MSFRKRLPLVAGGLAVLAVLAAGSAVAVGWGDDRGNAIRAGLSSQQPRNVILLIGDGMGTQEITAARYYQGVAQPAERRPDAVHRLRHDLVGRSRPRRRRYLPDYDPDSASTGTMWATGKKTIDERISQGPSSADQRPRREPAQTVLEIAQSARQEGRQRLDRRDHRRDAGRARLAHLAARLPGPGRHGRLPDRDQGRGRPRLDRRAGGRPQDRRAPRRRPRPLRPDDHRRSGRRQDGRSSRPRPRATSYVTDAAGLAAVTTPRSRSSASSTPATCRWSGPARRPDSARATTPGAVHRGPAPGQRAEPGGHDRARRSSCSENRKGFFLQVEGASIDKQDHATNACGQIGETVAFDKAIGVALDYQRQPPGHAGRRHRRPRAHQPDRGRGRQRLEPADRLLDQPAHQGRPDAAR